MTSGLGAEDDGSFVPRCSPRLCGAELSGEGFARAERVTVPRVVETRRVANGQEVISIAGGLELNTPVWANEMHEYPYLQWQAEVHRAKLKAAYPLAAGKIESAPSQGPEDVYARVSRLSVEQGLPSIHPGDALMNLITFDRTWLRPWAFYGIEDEEVRNELLALFPGWLLRGICGRCVLRGAQRKHGRSLAGAARAAGRRPEPSERGRFAGAGAGALQHVEQYAGGDV